MPLSNVKLPFRCRCSSQSVVPLDRYRPSSLTEKRAYRSTQISHIYGLFCLHICPLWLSLFDRLFGSISFPTFPLVDSMSLFVESRPLTFSAFQSFHFVSKHLVAYEITWSWSVPVVCTHRCLVWLHCIHSYILITICLAKPIIVPLSIPNQTSLSGSEAILTKRSSPHGCIIGINASLDFRMYLYLYLYRSYGDVYSQRSWKFSNT